MEEQSLLLYLAGVPVLGVIAQWLAWRMRLPSILLLLAFGVTLGTFLSPDELLAKLARTGDEIGPVYWTTCRVTACEPGREFGFAVLGPGDQAVNNWHYRLTPAGDGTDVTESFRLNQSLPVRVFWMFAGYLRGRRNVRDMRTTLERIKKVVEQD